MHVTWHDVKWESRGCGCKMENAAVMNITEGTVSATIITLRLNLCCYEWIWLVSQCSMCKSSITDFREAVELCI